MHQIFLIARSRAVLLVLACAAGCLAPEESSSGASPSTEEVTQAAVGSYTHLLRNLGPVACEEAEVLSAILADAAAPYNPNLPWRYSPMWGSSERSCVKETSAALGTDYIRCSHDHSTARNAEGAIRRYGETAYYYCATQRFRVIEGVMKERIAGTTYLFQHRPGGWMDDLVGKPHSLCYSGIKLDGTPIASGRVQCFRGGTPLHRAGDALIGVSMGAYNDVAYRFAIFEENNTTVDCGYGTALPCP